MEKRVFLTVGVAAVLAGLLVAAAMAATPTPGCYGVCGGDLGPVTGTLFVSSNHRSVSEFLIEEKCLGTHKTLLPPHTYVTIGDELTVPTMRVTKKGSFRFTGKATRYVGSGSKTKKLHVALEGHFVSAKKASLTLKISAAKCGTKHIRLKLG